MEAAPLSRPFGLDVNALRASYAVAAQDPDLVMRFFARLFHSHPVLRPLFDGRAMPIQREMLTRALFDVIQQLDEPRVFARTLRTLGVRHLHYGVTEQMYAWVGEAFVAALAEALGTSWTPRVQDAWQEFYGVMSAFMAEGAELTCVPTLRAAS